MPLHIILPHSRPIYKFLTQLGHPYDLVQAYDRILQSSLEHTNTGRGTRFYGTEHHSAQFHADIWNSSTITMITYFWIGRGIRGGWVGRHRGMKWWRYPSATRAKHCYYGYARKLNTMSQSLKLSDGSTDPSRLCEFIKYGMFFSLSWSLFFVNSPLLE